MSPLCGFNYHDSHFVNIRGMGKKGQQIVCYIWTHLVTYNLVNGHMGGTGHHVTEIIAEVFKNSGLFNRTNKPAKN